MSTVAERVARGAALLDEKRPGWAERIDLSRLKMSDCWDCVLGQVFGGEFEDHAAAEDLTWFSPFCEGLNALDVGGYEHGFDGSEEYVDLRAEWRRVIAERRSA